MIQRAAKIIKAAKFEDGTYAIRGGLEPEGAEESIVELPVIQAAREGADALLANAQAEADRLLSNAKLEAAKIRTLANQEAEALKARVEAEAHAAGREAGFAQGHEEAVAAVLNEQSGLLLQLASAIDGLDHEHERWLAERTQELAKLALLIAAKLLQAEPGHARGVVLELAETALKRLNDKSRVRLRVSPADAAIVSQAKERLLLNGGEIGSLEIVADPQVGAGGCLVETRTGVVDARFATQLAEIAQGLFLPPFKPEADPVVSLALEALKEPQEAPAPAPAKLPRRTGRPLGAARATEPPAPEPEAPAPPPAEGAPRLNKLLAARRKKG